MSCTCPGSSRPTPTRDPRAGPVPRAGPAPGRHEAGVSAGMDFGWNPAQQELHRRLRAVGAQAALAPGAPGPGVGPQAGAWPVLAAAGVLGLPIPEQYGGLGQDPLTCCYALEALGYGGPDLGP